MDRVKPLKIEKISGGGSQDNLYPHDLNPNEDGVEARGIIIQNDSSNDNAVEISRDASNNMTFKDGVVSGTQTLADLLGGEGSDDDQVDVVIDAGETFTVKLEHQHIYFEQLTILGEYVVNGCSVALGGEGSSGEANTASNIGSGVGVFKQKNGVDLELKSINAGSNKVTITDDTGNNEIDIDVAPGNIAHQDLSGAGSNTHAQIDTHVGATNNPHSTDIGNLGSGTLAELNSALTDATLDDSSSARTPSSHASSHENGGADEISVAGLSGELADNQPPKAHASSHASGGSDSVKIDDLAAADDNTDLNATTSAHGLLPKLGGGTTNFLRADGTWAAPPSSSVMFSAYDDTYPETEFTTTFTDLELTVETKKTSGFTHSTVTNPEEVTITSAGTYKIDLQISLANTTANSACGQIRLVKDSGGGYSEIAGSLAWTPNMNNTIGFATAAVTMILDLAADDKIKAQAARYDGTGTLKFNSDSSRLTIVKM